MENLRSLEPQAKISHSYKKKRVYCTLGPSWPTQIIWSIISAGADSGTIFYLNRLTGRWNSFTDNIYLNCILDPNIFLGAKSFKTQTFFRTKNFSHPEQFIDPQKEFWIQKYLRPQNILDPKKLFDPQRLWTPKNFVPKNLNPITLWAQKTLWPQKSFAHKNLAP